MSDDEQDVTPESSTGAAPEPESAPPAVTTEVTEPREDPLRNLKAEFNRKLSEVNEGLAAIATYLRQNQTQMPPQYTQQEPSDEMLAQLAQAGDASALQKLIQRQTDRRVDAGIQQRTEQAAVTSQLNVLYGKYPVLRSDPSHPLTQAALAHKQALLHMGRTNNYQTDLEAIRNAIADNPHLATQSTPPPQNYQSQGGARGQAGLGDAAPRRQPARTNSPARQLSDKERDIARRMGIKDPAKALDRLIERQNKGRSSVSPQVAMIVRDQEGR